MTEEKTEREKIYEAIYAKNCSICGVEFAENKIIINSEAYCNKCAKENFYLLI